MNCAFTYKQITFTKSLRKGSPDVEDTMVEDTVVEDTMVGDDVGTRYQTYKIHRYYMYIAINCMHGKQTLYIIYTRLSVR